MNLQPEPVIVTRVPEGFRVAVCGPVHTNTGWLETELERVVAARPKQVDLDLARMPYISSMGLGVLVSFRKRIIEAGGALRIVAIQKPVFGVFRFAYLEKVFQIESTAVVSAEAG